MENNKDSGKYLVIGAVLLVLLGGFFMAYNKRGEISAPPQENVENTNIQSGVGQDNSDGLVTDGSSTTTENSSEAVDEEENTTDEYKALIQKGHELYLAGKYSEALVYFNQAVGLQRNDRIYRSLYTSYLALKNYPEAEKAIRNSVKYNTTIPNNWVEYASFENLYMQASFESVSQIYQDALKATKENIDVVTAYAAYLTEQKKYEEAITYLEKAKSIYPANSSVYQKEIDYLKTKI